MSKQRLEVKWLVQGYTARFRSLTLNSIHELSNIQAALGFLLHTKKQTMSILEEIKQEGKVDGEHESVFLALPIPTGPHYALAQWPSLPSTPFSASDLSGPLVQSGGATGSWVNLSPSPISSTNIY